jgi:hypothetical protein
LPLATILHGYVGALVHIQEAAPSPEEMEGSRRIPMRELFDKVEKKSFDIIHMDIQGAEESVLKEMLSEGLFGSTRFIFCSTHGNHQNCLAIIESSGFPVKYLWNDPVNGGYGDGLIACEIGKHE